MDNDQVFASSPEASGDEAPREQRPEGDQQDPEETTGDFGRRPPSRRDSQGTMSSGSPTTDGPEGAGGDGN